MLASVRGICSGFRSGIKTVTVSEIVYVFKLTRNILITAYNVLSKKFKTLKNYKTLRGQIGGNGAQKGCL